MALPNNPLVAKVAMVYVRDTRTFVNTFHVSQAAPWTLADLQSLCTAFSDWWTNDLKPLVPSAVTLTQIQARKLDPSNPIGVDLGITPPSPGTRAGTPLPGNVTLSISERTGLAGRKYRGRFYTPAIISSDVDYTKDIVNSTLVIGYLFAGTQLIDALHLVNMQLVIFHKADNSFDPVKTIVVDSILDSQRRRLPGRGR